MTAPRPTAASPSLAVAATTVIVESVLLWLLATSQLTPALFLLAHVAVLSGLGWTIKRISDAGGNTTGPVILAIAVAATGPIGALGSLIAGVRPGRNRVSPRLLQQWYQRIALSADVDQITRLCDDVASGRHVGLTTPPPQSFVTVLERGTLAERQAALGLMARHIHPAYLPALKAALQSSEPIIRVQAAAVATKIRPELRALVDKTVRDFEAQRIPPTKAFGLATDLEACVACGLLDASDRIRADVMIPRLKALGAEPAPAGGINVAVQASADQDAMLLQHGRFRELRVARRVVAARGALGRVRRHVRRARWSAPVSAVQHNQPVLSAFPGGRP